MFSTDETIKSSDEFIKNATVNASQFQEIFKNAGSSSLKYWQNLAETKILWKKLFTEVRVWNPPFVEWFKDGLLNASSQCLDKHLGTEIENKIALVWHGEPAFENGESLERRVFTFGELHVEVAKFAQGLLNLGLIKGDVAAIYMPLIPESIVAMLACARIGVTHSVVFGGFSADALKDRINDAKAKLIITANGGFRRGKILNLIDSAMQAALSCECVKNIIAVDRLGRTGNSWYQKNDLVSVEAQNAEKSAVPFHWYHNVLSSNLAEPADVSSEHPLFILYTSGTTGKPKGVVHSTAGYMLWAQTSFEWVFDHKKTDVFWCTADIGWVTGHTYVVYGPLAAGATTVIYEGAPDFPNFSRIWEMIEREKVSIFYTAPTAIRSFMKQGDSFPASKNLSSLRLLGSVGEPINPEAWRWYHKVIGNQKCPIVDTWWQTETGGIMISALPVLHDQKPGCAMRPLPGIEADVVSDDGTPVQNGQAGKLVIKEPWPSQLRTVHGDPERYKSTYWSSFSSKLDASPWYFAGDGAYKDDDGCIWITGRVDDVMNVAGHRIGTMELESALVGNIHVAEAAVVGIPDEVKGTSIFAFVSLKSAFKSKIANAEGKMEMSKQLKEHVSREIGSFAKPEQIRFTDVLPKTRSGKIMRRLLRDVASGKSAIGDTTTLEDMSALVSLADYREE